MNIPHANGAALSPAVLTTDEANEAESGKRRRRFLGRRDPDPDPDVQFVIEDDEQVVARVALAGRHGIGKTMRMDAEDWHRVAEEYGRGWVLVPGARGRFDICSGRTALAHLAGQSGRSPCVCLARLVMKAGPGEVVTYADRDKLNLRRRNLQVVNRKDWLRTIRPGTKVH